MLKSCLVTLAVLQQVLAYHHHGLRTFSTTPDDKKSELPQDNHQKFINFADSGDIKRSGRQLSGGFDWDSPSSQSFGGNDFNRRRFNGWNSNSDDSSDSFIFADDFDNRNFYPRTTQRIPTRPTRRRKPTTQRVPTSTVQVPGMQTARTPCEDRCLSTPEYNPVCGDDNMTYFSSHRLICAQRCGKRVNLLHPGACSRIRQK